MYRHKTIFTGNETPQELAKKVESAFRQVEREQDGSAAQAAASSGVAGSSGGGGGGTGSTTITNQTDVMLGIKEFA
jgi:hypothetical protein